MSALVGVPSWLICTVKVTTGASRAPPIDDQHGRILERTPSISLAVTTVARLGAAGAWRVISFGGLGCCSGVCCLVLESWFLRMLSTSASTLGFFGGSGGFGGGLGGSTFFASGFGGSGLGGSGFFSSLGGSGCLGLSAITSSVGLGGSGLGFSTGAGATGLSSAVSSLGGSGAGGGSM